jgi:hypothetical protein
MSKFIVKIIFGTAALIIVSILAIQFLKHDNAGDQSKADVSSLPIPSEQKHSEPINQDKKGVSPETIEAVPQHPLRQIAEAGRLSPVELPKAESVAQLEESEKGSQCYLVKFKHEAIRSHSDGEACLRHDNQISLNEFEKWGVSGRVNKSAVCIRVNGAAVKFTPGRSAQGAEKKDSFIIGPLAGPNSLVSVEFCTGGANLPNQCVVKRDEFLSALGGLDEEEDRLGEVTPPSRVEAHQFVGWDGSKEMSRDEVDLEAEAAKLQLKGGPSEGSRTLFTGWKAEGWSKI